MKRDIAQLLFLIDTAYDHVSWHGPNLRGALRGVTPGVAAWRPQPGRHNIWELLVHAAYWKYVAWRRLTGAKRGSFSLEGSNWFQRPQAPRVDRSLGRRWASDLRADLDLLDTTHRTLRDAVARLDAAALDRHLGKSAVTPRVLVTGVAAHDLYHAGQIQLLKRLGGR